MFKQSLLKKPFAGALTGVLCVAEIMLMSETPQNTMQIPQSVQQDLPKNEVITLTEESALEELEKLSTKIRILSSSENNINQVSIKGEQPFEKNDLFGINLFKPDIPNLQAIVTALDMPNRVIENTEIFFQEMSRFNTFTMGWVNVSSNLDNFSNSELIEKVKEQSEILAPKLQLFITQNKNLFNDPNGILNFFQKYNNLFNQWLMDKSMINLYEKNLSDNNISRLKKETAVSKELDAIIKSHKDYFAQAYQSIPQISNLNQEVTDDYFIRKKRLEQLEMQMKNSDVYKYRENLGNLETIQNHIENLNNELNENVLNLENTKARIKDEIHYLKNEATQKIQLLYKETLLAYEKTKNISPKSLFIFGVSALSTLLIFKSFNNKMEIFSKILTFFAKKTPNVLKQAPVEKIIIFKDPSTSNLKEPFISGTLLGAGIISILKKLKK